MLNDQEGFHEQCGTWECLQCGFHNMINAREIYRNEDEFQADCKNPTKGLSDEDALELLSCFEEGCLDGRENVILVRRVDTGERFVKKVLTTYDKSIYEYLRDHPVEQMPRIYDLYESSNCLIVIEEWIRGTTVEEKTSLGIGLEEGEALRIAREVCKILHRLHTLPRPIIHRDVKPSNVMIAEDGTVYLLDMNVAKWYDPEKTDDTRYLGTPYYAAPEQVGYGFRASSPKTDIYALGILLNVMLTGKLPKEEKVQGEIWKVIERASASKRKNATRRRNCYGSWMHFRKLDGMERSKEKDGQWKRNQRTNWINCLKP